MLTFRWLRALPGVLIKLAALAAVLGATQAHAVPSFARQTGMDCAGCHVGAFGPQLTPAGIRFKLNGYTDTDGKDGKLPLSGMVIASWTCTKTDNPAPEDHFKANNNTKLDEASIFLAGRITEHTGAFVQATYSGIDHTSALDQTDLRYARTVELGGKETVLGLSVNNNPTVQDPFNSSPTWRFPFNASEASPGMGDAASLINGGLEGRVLGATAYALYDNTWYGELGTYRSLSPSSQRHLGLGEDPQRLGGNAYWRLGWMQDQKSQAYHLGLFGWNARLTPDRTVGGAPDKHHDIGIDGGYQFLGTREHVFAVDGSYVRERLNVGDGPLTKLHETRLSGSYHYNQTWGASLGLFSTHGTDPAARTSGTLLQVDWTPWGKESASAPAPFGWANLRLGAQYWMYNKFNGSSGASAKDHNTLSVFAWTSF